MRTQNLLEEIIKIQERTIKKEKIISNSLHEKYLDEMDVAGNCKYFYRILERKFKKALEDIKFLNHYIEQKNLKKSSIDEQRDSNKGKSNTNLKANQKEIIKRKHGKKK